MYKLIALDMDGTLLREDGTLSSRNKQAIRAARDKGVHVLLASGRPLAGMEPFLQELALTSTEDYVLSYNGALVQNVGTRQVLSHRHLTGQDVRELYALGQVLEVNVHAFCAEQGLIAPRNSTYTELERATNELTLTLTDFSQLDPTAVILKVMMVDEPAQLSRAIARLPAELHTRFTVVQSAPFFLEFLHPECNKGSGVAALAKHLGLNAESVICVGDAGNDKHMLEYAGLGVAMGNATAELKSLADHVTLSNQDDGVARVIEQFIL